MDVRAVRILTTLVIASLCGLAVVRGWSIVRFSGAMVGINASTAQADVVMPWTAVPGLASVALQASLTTVTDPIADIEGSRKRGDELGAILSVQPLSSVNWLSIAGIRLVTGQPLDKVFAALALSWLTGPNEGSVMLDRGVFGLLQWETLPADARKRTIADLAGAILGTTVRDDEILPAKRVLAAKPAATRREVADLLRADRVPQNELVRMGL